MNTKRIIALVICAVMVLSMIPVAALSTSAAEVDGDWTTYRFASEYPQPDDDPDEEKIYKPEAGYMYTNEGFTIVPADYKNTTPALTIQTKDKKPVKEGIYIQFRVDDYSYDGGTGADQWICLSFTNQEKVAPGSTAFGGGWLTLIRGAGNGAATALPHYTVPDTEEAAGTFIPHGGANAIEVPMDADGREIYTFETTWNGSEYEMKLNGVVLGGAAKTTEVMEAIDSTGEFYVGLSAQANVKDGTAALTILKFGTSADDATTPVGSDEKEPEENIMEIAPIADANTIEPNMPAILWNPETTNHKGGNNCTFTALGDNTWRVNASDAQVFFQFSPKRTWSYDAVDFPVFGIMFRNCWAEGGTLWYAAGDVMGPKDGCTLPFSVYEGEFYGEDEEYIFLPIDISELWEGRINCVRLDFALTDETTREFDICFAGMFRSEDEAYAYAESYLGGLGVDTAPAEEETDAPADDETDAPAGDETNAPAGDETNAPAGDETNAPADGTTAEGGDTSANDSTDTPEEGCASVFGFGAVAVMVAAAAAVVLKKKD